MHKPYGFLCQFVCELERKKLIGSLYPFPAGTMAIGRLDEDSEGLLFLTTDGLVSEQIRSSNIEKEYHVQLDGMVSEEAIDKLQKGVEIGIRNIKYMTKSCQVFILEKVPDFAPRTKKIRDDRHGPTSWISITITEGKFRQIRKMTAAVGFPTLRLFRVRIGKIHLGTLAPAEVREVNDFLNP